ncbi:cobalamin-5'-phosphate synthase [Aliiruegeria haliotis]|uniref:Adenosylcobinamide-GDP ribazoletransferase n=1 Tax=Aliiruegeria haliotis TaxID=1280846 RepID=A0A2T0RUX2_9RHOB|nr:adenosylcobinamide-GDP ribazoletransferase [Aliiruegeria haliotis]PRY24981.1 cobalamin-5'-phosphate synthase [Aliiruegeria haliotis]
MPNQRPYSPLRDIALATALLSRLPVPVDADFARSRGAKAAWAYPLAGLFVAAIAGGLGLLLLWLGLPGSLAAGIALGAQIVMTGAMHEDGLADAADGLWGGWDKERRLEIMKDSRIGTYGVIALVLSVGLRWSALTALADHLLPAMLVAALLSRAVMLFVMAALPNARDGGLSKSIGRPDLMTATIGAGLAFAVSLAIVGTTGLPLALVTLLAALACAAIAQTKIGGQTGDILGATQQISAICCLAAATALM